MSSNIANIRTYHRKFFGRAQPKPGELRIVVHEASKINVQFGEDGRAYAAFKRPLTKQQMQAINAKRRES